MVKGKRWKDEQKYQTQMSRIEPKKLGEKRGDAYEGSKSVKTDIAGEITQRYWV